MAQSFQTTTLSGPAKLKAVTSLLDKLSLDLQSINLLPHQRDSALEELKIYGRDPTNADPIFTKEGIDTLTRHAFNSPSNTTSRNAMRVLANAMLLKPETRQMFVDLGYESKACNKLNTDNYDDEFLVSRIIFFTTYDTNIDKLALIDEHHLAEYVVHNLSRHAKLLAAKSSKTKVDPMEDMALNETLRLQFNMTHFCPERISLFTPGVPHIIPLLWKQDISASKPLDPPFGSIINALLNLDLDSKELQSALFPKAEQNSVAARLVELLGLSLKSYGDTELEQSVTPLVGVILKVYKDAPESVKEYFRQSLLPTEEDRKGVLGQGTSLSSRLLKNSTNPMTPQLRESVSHLLFDMSDRDATKFVDNVGYGFASGFLFQNNLPIPSNASEAYSTGSTGVAARPRNPVTGQYLDTEQYADLPEMTEEEKEREAERLFVLFERLKKNGIINVQNPVEQAVHSGRFDELGDDRVEELE